MTQLLPSNGSDLLDKFRVMVYQALVSPQEARPPRCRRSRARLRHLSCHPSRFALRGIGERDATVLLLGRTRMGYCKSFVATVAVVAAGVIGAPRTARAQGCVLIRQNGPLLGQGMSPDLQPGQYEFNFSIRNSTATKHYNGDVEQVQRQTLGTYVKNTQQAYDFSLRYQATHRLGLSASIPLINAAWALPYPLAPTPGPRVPQQGLGFGDLTFAGRVLALGSRRARARQRRGWRRAQAADRFGRRHGVLPDDWRCVESEGDRSVRAAGRRRRRHPDGRAGLLAVWQERALQQPVVPGESQRTPTTRRRSSRGWESAGLRTRTRW